MSVHIALYVLICDLILIFSPGESYSCDCPKRLSGKRCEYGYYCNPNPCKNGAACEEGDTGPLCKCRFYTGELCDFDVNECDSNPCFGGGTCINEIGSYRCQCPFNMTGKIWWLCSINHQEKIL